MENIWIGAEFSAAGNGLLLLGESTYGGDASVTGLIQQWIRCELRDSTFSRIFNAFSGIHTSAATVADREAFWAKIAFGNFIQQSIGADRKYRPSREHYLNAAAILPRTLKYLRPKGVIILGTEQAAFSRPIIEKHNIPFVVTRHPTSWGLETSMLTKSWKEIQAKLNP